jgi:hypothetical protein
MVARGEVMSQTNKRVLFTTEIHPDTIADRAIAATLNGDVHDPVQIYQRAREFFRTATGCTAEQARTAIRRAVVRAALKSQDPNVRTKGMAVHTRR